MSRNRSREDAGKSINSWKKHKLIQQAVSGQAWAFRIKNPGRRILLIDGNAGDGIGVPQEQLDLFDDNLSRPTPGILVQLGEKLGNTDVVLCEKDVLRRDELARQFVKARILSDHALAAGEVNGQTYAIWVSDPCGAKEQGVDHMQRLAGLMPRSDFVVVFNEVWISSRLAATKAERWKTHREKYLPMLDMPGWWLTTLQRQRMARTPIIDQSNNFKCRVFVVADFLSDAVRRRPFEVIA
jgi:hypothetical protein